MFLISNSPEYTHMKVQSHFIHFQHKMLCSLYNECANTFLPAGSPCSFHHGRRTSLPSARMLTELTSSSLDKMILLDLFLLNILPTFPYLLHDCDFTGDFF